MNGFSSSDGLAGVIAPGEPIDYLGLAIAAAESNVPTGGGPFGAVIAFEDGTFVPGINRVVDGFDPTAHAEVAAIRNACALRRTHLLTGAVLYASCAPCPMCLSAAMWARVSRIVYAATPEDAAEAGFDDAEFYHQIYLVASVPGNLPALPFSFDRVNVVDITHEPRDNAQAPFAAWNALAERAAY